MLLLARCRRLPILPSREARVPKTIRPNTLAVAAVPAMMISDQNVGSRFAARLLRRFEIASVEHLQKSNVRSHVNPCGNDYAINWSTCLMDPTVQHPSQQRKLLSSEVATQSMQESMQESIMTLRLLTEKDTGRLPLGYLHSQTGQHFCFARNAHKPSVS